MEIARAFFWYVALLRTLSAAFITFYLGSITELSSEFFVNISNFPCSNSGDHLKIYFYEILDHFLISYQFRSNLRKCLPKLVAEADQIT